MAMLPPWACFISYLISPYVPFVHLLILPGDILSWECPHSRDVAGVCRATVQVDYEPSLKSC